jgi:hypothetical protein
LLSDALLDFDPQGLEKLTEEAPYTYRQPPRTQVTHLVGLFAPTFLFAMYAAVLIRSWALGIAYGALVLASAALAAWLSSKFCIVVDSEGIRWPPRRRKLRWDEVASSEIVRILRLEYVRVTKKSGKVMWIALGHPDGDELRRRLLAGLDLR